MAIPPLAVRCAALAACLLAGSCSRIQEGLTATHCEIVPQDLGGLAQMLEHYAADHGGVYPDTLTVLFEQRPLGRGGCPGTWFADPWGRPYLYEVSSDRRSFRVSCLGADGIPGGDGTERDLSASSSSRVR